MATALTLLAAPAFAVTVSPIGTAADVDASLSTTVTPGYAWADTMTVFAGNRAGQYASPFNRTADRNAGYFALRAGETAELIADAPSHRLTLLWGTIDLTDTRNVLSFYGNGRLVETVTGRDVVRNGATRNTTALVEISGFTFDRVVFSASQNAFEFSNVEVAPVPLPATGLMLLAAVGGAVAWRRRARQP